MRILAERAANKEFAARQGLANKHHRYAEQTDHQGDEVPHCTVRLQRRNTLRGQGGHDEQDHRNKRAADRINH